MNIPVGGAVSYTFEVRIEMRQVTWPTRHEVFVTTWVVIVTRWPFSEFISLAWIVPPAGLSSTRLNFLGTEADTVEDIAKQWYIIHTYSGFEKKVKESTSKAGWPLSGCRKKSAA